MYPRRLLTDSVAKVISDEYILAVSRGSTVPPNDHGAVAVIDGQTIKFTPFRTANVPPPMAMVEFEVGSPAIDVAFASDCTAIAVLHRDGLNIYGLESKGLRLSSPKLRESIELERAISIYEDAPLQVAFSGQHEIYVLREGTSEPSLLCTLSRPGQESRAWQETAASSLIIHSSDDGIVAQDALGKLHRISSLDSTPMPIRFPSLLPWASFITKGDQRFAFGLSRNGHLSVNSRQLARNCTSFIVTPSHLIFTTSNHLVKFVHLAGSEDGEYLSPWSVSLPFPH